MFDDDGAAPASLHEKITPAAHSSPIGPWTLPVAVSIVLLVLVFGMTHWGGAPPAQSIAEANPAPNAPSSPLPDPSPTPTPQPKRTTAAAVAPVRIIPESYGAPAPAAAPAAPPTDSPEVAAQKEDVKAGLDARHSSTLLAFADPHAAGPSVPAGVAPGSNPSAGAAPSGYDLLPGAFIPGRWDVNVDSSVPGSLLKGTITQDVFDSTGRNVVLHAGGTIIGVAAAVDVNGVARLASEWNEVQQLGREIFFDGTGAGAKGENGLSASLDTHANRAYMQALLYTVLDAGGVALGNAFTRNGTQINFGGATQQFASPSRIAPTLHIVAGTPFIVVVRSKFTVPQ